MVPALLALLLQVPAPAPLNSTIDLCEVTVSSRAEIARLFELARDPDDHDNTDDGRVRVYATPREQVELRAAGFQLSVVQRDLSRFYAERLASQPTVGPGPGTMGGWRTLAEIVAELDRLTATYPTIVSPKYSIGTTHEGRPIWAIRISDNPSVDEAAEPVAWFDALHHAREPMGGESLVLLANWIVTRYPSDATVRRMVETRQTVIVPCVNPDGYEYNRQTNPGGGGMWRKNRKPNGDGTFGVDLNRNYGWEWGPQHPGSSSVTSDETYRGPSPFSELETQACRDALALHTPGMSVSAHTYGALWLYAWGYNTVVTTDDPVFREYGERATAVNGFQFGCPWQVLYIANGCNVDWHYSQGVFAFSPEIGNQSDGFWPLISRIPALFEDVRPAYLDVVRWSGGWAERTGVTWTQAAGAGDGDAYPEPGETWDLAVTLANGGVAPVSGVLSLASSSPHVSVRNGSVPFSVGPEILPVTTTPSGPHARATATPAPLQVEFAANAAIGNAYTLDLGIAFDGLVTPDVVTVLLGEPRILAFDDMEVAAFGWTTTTSGANYAFERAVPQGTTSGGQQAQPGTDATPGAGTRCWVTGAAAGASSSTNDVDGTTTLTSPRFHASGFGHIELSYARWFANLPGGPLDDHLLVQISNDDGANWVQLENPSNDNSWRTRTVSLEAFVPLTDRLRLRVTCADAPNNDLTEAAIDDLVLRAWSSLPTLGVWGATTAGAGARLFVDGPSNRSYRVRIATAEQAGQTTPGTAGQYFLAGTVTDLASGTTDAQGNAIVSWTVASGSPVFLQVLLDEGGPQAAWSNLLRVNLP